MLIRVADLTNKLVVKEVLFKFSKVYKIFSWNKETLIEIPSGVEDVEGPLGIDIP